MNLEELVAIDVHTHAETSTRMLPDAAEKETLEARGRYFRYQVKHPTIAQMAAYYRERKMAFVVFTVDHERGLGVQRISNEEVAESARACRAAAACGSSMPTRFTLTTSRPIFPICRSSRRYGR